MSRRKRKGFYDAIRNIADPTVKEQILINLQSHAYRSIINDDLKTLPIQIDIDNDGDLYGIFKENYNQYIGMPIPEEDAVFVSYVVPRKNKSIKKKKKNATRIKKEMLRMCVNGFLENDDKTKKCIRDFESVIRESFVIIRKVLKEEAYNALPDQLKILNGTSIPSNQYYVQSDVDDKTYTLNKDLVISGMDRRFVQYQVAESVFFIVRNI